mgnify:CR=1 FL=1
MWYLWIAVSLFVVLCIFSLVLAAQIGYIKNQTHDLLRGVKWMFIFSILWIITIPILIWLRLRGTSKK